MKEKVVDCYTLDEATSNIGRAYPQIQTGAGPIYTTFAYLQERERGVLPSSFNVSFDRLIIEKGAKKTDALSCAMFSSYGYIFSEKLIALLQQFELPTYKLFKAIIQKRGTDIFYENYYALMIEKKMYRYLAFDTMEFIDVTDRNNINTIKIRNVDEFENLWYSQHRRLKLSEDSSYIFTDKFPGEIDFFGIGAINASPTFVSKRLRDALISHKITGLDFSEDIKLFQF